MHLGLGGKRALVTGASQGIGLAVAEGLAAEGVEVALSARTAATLEAAVSALRERGGRAVGIPADVSRPEEIERLLSRVREEIGAPDILVVNAGGPPAGTPTVLSEAAWAKAHKLTLMSAVRLAYGVLPAMRTARWGRIINITSVSVKEPILNLTLSNAFRAAVTGFAKTLSLEVAPDGVTVNNVAPGYTATERLNELFEDAAARARLEASIPAKRFADPAEIAAAAVFLASVPAAYITGQTLVVDGGATRGVH
jgi:3-oxoacyl-[acyl-carrier protein] reductase